MSDSFAAMALPSTTNSRRVDDNMKLCRMVSEYLEPLGYEVDIASLLFGTGMRGGAGQASATVGGLAVPAAGPVAQGEFAGLDQVNLGPLPTALSLIRLPRTPSLSAIRADPPPSGCRVLTTEASTPRADETAPP